MLSQTTCTISTRTANCGCDAEEHTLIACNRVLPLHNPNNAGAQSACSAWLHVQPYQQAVKDCPTHGELNFIWRVLQQVTEHPIEVCLER